MSLLGATEPRPRVPPLGEISSLLDDAVSHRASLAVIELAEARAHAQTSVVLLGAFILLAFLGGVALTLTFAGLVWESPSRAWWLAGITMVYLGAATTAGLFLRHRLKSWRPLADIRNQLQLDHQCLTRLIRSMLP